MPLPRDNPQILDGTRAWPEAQAAFLGEPDPLRTRWNTVASWYDTSVSEWEGAFCMVRSGSDLEDLIGDVVLVRYKDQRIHVYCVGGADLSVDFALSRTAFFWIEQLSEDEIDVIVQPIVKATS